MTDIEAPSRPDFHSDSCYTILGCGKSGSPEELRKAYRDLSRKYHPDRYYADKETNHTFQRVYVAYLLVCKAPPNGGEDVKLDRETMRQGSLEDAKRNYASEFGEFKEKYYSRGAIVALPYPYQLKERLENGKCLRDAFTLRLGCLQFSFFRSFLIKKELGFFFLLSEIICVWGSLVLAVWNFLLEDFPEIIDEIPYVRDAGIDKIPHISIIGGVAVLIGSFIQHFWYGFTRHPIITDSEYVGWLKNGETSTSGELGEIYRICSQYYHSDVYKRSQVLSLLLCFPILLVDYIPAILLSIPVYLFLLCQNCCTKNESPKTHLAYQFAKSIGGLLVVVGSYLAWVLGGNYAKLAVAGVLYVNQHLYSAILFRKSFFGFLQSVVFQGLFAITIVRRPRNETSIKEERSTDDTDIEQGMMREEQKPVKKQDPPPTPVGKRNQVLSPSQRTIEESIIEIVPVVSESPQKTPASGVDQADPDNFGAKFDGFYTRPRSYSEKSTPHDSVQDAENVVLDHRGKPHVKPVPGWYQKGEVITDTQVAANNAKLASRNLFQCGADTTLKDDGYFNPTESMNDDRETATAFNSTTAFASTRASTAFTANTSKIEEKKSEEGEGPDLINIARSAKRRIEAEFYARIYGSSAGSGLSSPVSPDRKASGGYAPSSFLGAEDEQKQHRFDVPRTIEMRTSVKRKTPNAESPRSPSSYPPMMDAVSDTASGEDDRSVPSDESANAGFIPMYPSRREGGNSTNKDDNRAKSPDGEIDNLLGPFVPLVKSVTTRSNNYSVGASQVTRMKSNKEREAKAADEMTEEPVSFVLRHHPDIGLSGFRNINEGKQDTVKPRRSRTTGDVPDLVVGYDQASADESEITMDRRQFRKKRQDDAPSFWEYWTSPANSTLTRSVT